MNQTNEQFKKALQSVRMTSEEKEAVRGAILSEISTNPLNIPAILASVRNSSSIRHKLRRKTLTRHNILTRMPIAILIALLMGGGVSYAAAGTVPGDTLYPVKVHVTENAESVFAIGGNARAKLEEKLALRRLEEAEKLEAKHDLSAEGKAQLKENFDEHTTSIEAELKGMEKREDANEISSEFELSLAQHLSALGLIGVHIDENDKVEMDDTDSSNLSATTSAHATTSLKHKDHLDGILNAVFRSNNKNETGEDNMEHSGTSSDIERNDVKNVHENESSETDEGHAETKAAGSVNVGDTLKVNTNTHLETEEHDGIKLGL